MAIGHLKTKYLEHLHLDAILLRLVLFLPHKFDHLYTRLVFCVPTIIVLKYTNHNLFPSNDLIFFQIFLVQNLLLYFYFFDFLKHFQLMFPFLQTIVLIDMVLPLRLFFQNDQLNGLFFLF